jgi:hypothetical protein
MRKGQSSWVNQISLSNFSLRHRVFAFIFLCVKQKKLPYIFRHKTVLKRVGKSTLNTYGNVLLLFFELVKNGGKVSFSCIRKQYYYSFSFIFGTFGYL